MIRLRKGPEDIPPSLLVLLFSCLLLVPAIVLPELVLPSDRENSISLSFINAGAGYVAYWLVLLAFNKGHRLVPVIASIMACGSILSLAMFSLFLVLLPLVGQASAAAIAWLIIVWTIPVKGHIIARAIERNEYTGIAIALMVFIIQMLLLQFQLSTAEA